MDPFSSLRGLTSAADAFAPTALMRPAPSAHVGLAIGDAFSQRPLPSLTPTGFAPSLPEARAEYATAKDWNDSSLLISAVFTAAFMAASFAVRRK